MSNDPSTWSRLARVFGSTSEKRAASRCNLNLDEQTSIHPDPTEIKNNTQQGEKFSELSAVWIPWLFGIQWMWIWPKTPGVSRGELSLSFWPRCCEETETDVPCKAQSPARAPGFFQWNLANTEWLCQTQTFQPLVKASKIVLAGHAAMFKCRFPELGIPPNHPF